MIFYSEKNEKEKNTRGNSLIKNPSVRVLKDILRSETPMCLRTVTLDSMNNSLYSY